MGKKVLDTILPSINTLMCVNSFSLLRVLLMLFGDGMQGVFSILNYCL